MIKVSPVAYKLPDNSIFTAEHSYEAVFEGVLRIETRLFIDKITFPLKPPTMRSNAYNPEQSGLVHRKYNQQKVLISSS